MRDASFQHCCRGRKASVHEGHLHSSESVFWEWVMCVSAEQCSNLSVLHRLQAKLSDESPGEWTWRTEGTEDVAC